MHRAKNIKKNNDLLTHFCELGNKTSSSIKDNTF